MDADNQKLRGLDCVRDIFRRARAESYAEAGGVIEKLFSASKVADMERIFIDGERPAHASDINCAGHSADDVIRTCSDV